MRECLHLVPAADAAPALPAATPRHTYLVHALSHPLSSLTVLAGVSAGVYLGSIAIVLLMAVVALGEAWFLAGRKSFQRSIDEYQVRQRRAARRRGREDRLEMYSMAREQLVELHQALDELERLDGGRIERRFELEELLDHYVDVALAHDRCLRALRSTDRGDLLRQLREQRALEGGGSRSRQKLLERRVEVWDTCRRRADRLADEMASISELIRLLVQRASCPEVPDLDDVTRRLLDLDDADAALRELEEPQALTGT